jgi:hypothetical protein
MCVPTPHLLRPTQDNIFEWHFTVRGPSGTPFEGGVYHGRILLPAEYPFKPPNIVWLTVRHLGPLWLHTPVASCCVSRVARFSRTRSIVNPAQR